MLLSLGSDHLDVRIKALGTKWRYISFYRHPKLARRGQSWEMFRSLASATDLS